MFRGVDDVYNVSIHAPREGCDRLKVYGASDNITFQFTHPGRGATLALTGSPAPINKFQFTHPGRGATH